MIFKIPSYARKIISCLTNSEYEAYLVGGCVRDLLLGIPPHDYDICTNATPDEMKVVFSFSNWKIIETGIKHGTITIHCRAGEEYEVTTYRVDGNYSDNRHPDSVIWTKDLIEDLSRRDFTMNAIALSPAKFPGDSQMIIDPFYGKNDISNKLIRCVGNPDDRFNEDALRMLRAMRFASTYEFQIEEKTAESIHRNYKLLEKVSAERIQSELKKLVCGKNSYQVLHDFSDVISFIIPEFKDCIGCSQNNKYHCYDVYEHIIHAVGFCDTTDYVTNMAVFLHDIAKPESKIVIDGIDHFYHHSPRCAKKAEEILTRLKFSNQDISDITTLIKYHDAYNGTPKKATIRRMLNNLGDERLFMKHIALVKADILAHSGIKMKEKLEDIDTIIKLKDEIIKDRECFKLSDLAINGGDIKSYLKIPQGKKIGIILKNIFNKVLSGELKNEFYVLLMEARSLSESIPDDIQK